MTLIITFFNYTLIRKERHISVLNKNCILQTIINKRKRTYVKKCGIKVIRVRHDVIRRKYRSEEHGRQIRSLGSIYFF